MFSFAKVTPLLQLICAYESRRKACDEPLSLQEVHKTKMSLPDKNPYTGSCFTRLF